MAVSPYATWDLTGALAALACGNVHERKACLEGYITWAASRFDTHLKFGRALEAGFTTDTMTKADAVEARANMSGALAGLPFVASTCIDLAGSVTSASNAVLATVNRTKEDAPVMAALKSQGAWCVARANTDELSMGCTGASPVDGVVKNPYLETGTSAGSNGGIAAAVAARLVPFGVGVDRQGDMRAPAALCGIVGFRPTLGRYSMGGVVTLSSTLDSLGLMARTVADVRYLDAVIDAYTPSPATEHKCEDCGSASCERVLRTSAARARVLALRTAAPAGGATAAGVSSAPGGGALQGLRVGVPRLEFFTGLHPAIAAGIERALSKLSKAGAELVTVDIPRCDGRSLVSAAAALTSTLLQFEAPRELACYLRSHIAAPPPPPKKFDEEGNEMEEELDDSDEARAARRAAAAPRPLDQLTSVSAIFAGVKLASREASLIGVGSVASATSPAAYREALISARPAVQASWNVCFSSQRVDVIVYPTVPSLPCARKGACYELLDAGNEAGGAPSAAVDDSAADVHASDVWFRNTRAACVAGLPALCVPCGYTVPPSPRPRGAGVGDRMPLSLEFVAPAGADERLLAIGDAFQSLFMRMPDPVDIARWAEGVTLP